MKRFIVSVLVLLPFSVLAQEPSRPQPPQRTAQRLYEQIGACNADNRDLQEYSAALNAQLGEKDAEIAKLKADLAKLKPTTK